MIELLQDCKFKTLNYKVSAPFLPSSIHICQHYWGWYAVMIITIIITSQNTIIITLFSFKLPIQQIPNCHCYCLLVI